MKRKVIKGWVGKDVNLNELCDEDVRCVYLMSPLHIVKTKGKKIDWFECEWPPKKIRITIEEVE